MDNDRDDCCVATGVVRPFVTFETDDRAMRIVVICHWRHWPDFGPNTFHTIGGIWPVHGANRLVDMWTAYNIKRRRDWDMISNAESRYDGGRILFVGRQKITHMSHVNPFIRTMLTTVKAKKVALAPASLNEDMRPLRQILYSDMHMSRVQYLMTLRLRPTLTSMMAKKLLSRQHTTIRSLMKYTHAYCILILKTIFSMR